MCVVGCKVVLFDEFDNVVGVIYFIICSIGISGLVFCLVLCFSVRVLLVLWLWFLVVLGWMCSSFDRVMVWWFVVFIRWCVVCGLLFFCMLFCRWIIVCRWVMLLWSIVSFVVLVKFRLF